MKDKTSPEIVTPDWVNAPDRQSIVTYDTKDGHMYGDARVIVNGDVLTLKPVSLMPKTFVFWLTGTITLIVWASAWALPVPPIVIGMLLVMAPMGAIIASLTAYGIQSAVESGGDYLVIDRLAKEIELPRQKVKILFHDVSRFQWICGRSQQSWHVEVDFHVVATNATGQLMRYHILGSPTKSLVKEIASFACLPYEELDFGRRGNRDADKDAP